MTDHAQTPEPSPARPRRRRPRWVMFALACVCFLALLTLCEWLYRAVIIARYQQAVSDWNAALYMPDTQTPLDYILRPNTAVDVPFFEARDQTFNLVTNADGLRGRPLKSDFPGARRILFLGDSYTLGWGLNEDQPTYVQAVEQILNAQSGTTTTLAFNAGVPGYNTEQQAFFLHTLLDISRFDQVVLCYVLNDTESQALVPLKPSVTYRYTWSWAATDAAELLHRLRTGDQTYFSPKKNILTNDYLPSYAPSSPKWKTTLRALEDIADLCHQRGIPLQMFILPDFNLPWGPDYPYTQIHAQIAAAAKSLQIPVVDLTTTFTGQQSQSYAIPGDGHPNPQAHKKIAETMAAELKALK